MDCRALPGRLAVRAASTTDALDQFRAALIARGIVPPEPIVANGRLHRCNAQGPRGRGDAAYLLHLDGLPAGGMENWRDGQGWQTWRLDPGRALTADERQSMQARAVAGGAQRRQEAALRHASAPGRALRIWAAARPALVNHPYLATKQVWVRSELRVRRFAFAKLAYAAHRRTHGDVLPLTRKSAAVQPLDLLRLRICESIDDC